MWEQGVSVLHEVVNKRRRHRPRKGLLGLATAVARIAQQAHFVLDLHHDDRVVAAVHFLDAPHEGREGRGIGLAVGLGQCR